MIKDILVNLSAYAKRDAVVDYAASLAAMFEAHLSGVAFAYEPVVAASAMGGAPIDFIDAQRAENRRICETAAKAFNEAASRAGAAAESHVFALGVAAAADQFGQMARRHDLSVLMQAGGDDDSAGGDMIIEAALFQSGRPILVVPYIQKGGVTLDRVMVCWDGGRTAARAIGDAMPILRKAKSVSLVMATGEEGKRDVVPGADMAHHLARHGVNVEVQRIVVEGNVHGALLSHAADISADFMVMGGFGHSRLREFILGGVTRAMLRSMAVPCLMSH
ncbi:MAG: universal stress protein [Alphaproteobacteria bacterium]